MKTIFRLTALATASLVLAGCASVNMDQAVRDTNDTTNTFTQGKLELSRTEQQSQARAKLSSELLAKPLGMDEAVQLALANSPAVQSLLALKRADAVRLIALAAGASREIITAEADIRFKRQADQAGTGARVDPND